MTIESKTYVWCTTSFIGMHYWPDAPIPVEYLGTNHRHVFHIEVAVEVIHDNRAVEFHLLKMAADAAINEMYGTEQTKWIGPRSCEQIAKELGTYLVFTNHFAVREIAVSEDRENGATVRFLV